MVIRPFYRNMAISHIVIWHTICPILVFMEKAIQMQQFVEGIKKINSHVKKLFKKLFILKNPLYFWPISFLNLKYPRTLTNFFLWLKIALEQKLHKDMDINTLVVMERSTLSVRRGLTTVTSRAVSLPPVLRIK